MNNQSTMTANHTSGEIPRFAIKIKIVDLEDDLSGKTDNFVSYCPGGVVMKSQCTLKEVYLTIIINKTKYRILLANECIGNHDAYSRRCYTCCKYGHKASGEDILACLIRMLDYKVEGYLSIAYVKTHNEIKIDLENNNVLKFNYEKVWPHLRAALMKAMH